MTDAPNPCFTTPNPILEGVELREAYARVREALEWCRTEIFSLCESIEDDPILEKALEGSDHERGYARGQMTTAKSIRNAMAEVLRVRIHEADETAHEALKATPLIGLSQAEGERSPALIEIETETHDMIAECAKRDGLTISAWIGERMRDAAQRGLSLPGRDAGLLGEMQRIDRVQYPEIIQAVRWSDEDNGTNHFEPGVGFIVDDPDGLLVPVRWLEHLPAIELALAENDHAAPHPLDADTIEWLAREGKEPTIYESAAYCFVCGEHTPMTAMANSSRELWIAHRFLNEYFEGWEFDPSAGYTPAALSTVQDGSVREGGWRDSQAAREALEAVRLTEAAEDAHANCPECDGYGEAEACERCFPAADEARLRRRRALALAGLLPPEFADGIAPLPQSPAPISGDASLPEKGA